MKANGFDDYWLEGEGMLESQRILFRIHKTIGGRAFEGMVVQVNIDTLIPQDRISSPFSLPPKTYGRTVVYPPEVLRELWIALIEENWKPCEGSAPLIPVPRHLFFQRIQ